jgi:3-oxoacyl-(acyl-carrier-protein) synthase
MQEPIVITATALALADAPAPFAPEGAAASGFSIFHLPQEVPEGRHTVPSQRMARLIAALAAKAGLPEDGFAGPDTGIVSGSRYGCALVFDMNRRLRQGGPRGIDAVGFAQATHSFPLSACAIDFGIQGPGLAFVSSQAAGMEALQCARDWLVEGRCERVIVAGFEDLHGPAAAHLAQIQAPGAAPVHEAMALILLERADSAAARGAPVLAQLRGTAILRAGADDLALRVAADRAFGAAPQPLALLLAGLGQNVGPAGNRVLVDCLSAGGLLAMIHAIEADNGCADWLVGAVDPALGGVAAGLHIPTVQGAI